MRNNIALHDPITAYEELFELYPQVFQSEVEALRQMLPVEEKTVGIEVGLGTGRFSKALNIQQGVEHDLDMREVAIRRGLEVANASADNLPYRDHGFDFVLMSFCVHYLHDLHEPFKEAFRVLKNSGSLVIGFIDKNRLTSNFSIPPIPGSKLSESTKLYSVNKLIFELNRVGFKHVKLCQTLFNELPDIKEFQPCKLGFGEGSFIAIQAIKKITSKRYGLGIPKIIC